MPRKPILLALAYLLLAQAIAHAGDAAPPARQTENIIFVLVDGLRWQEVFTGADESLLNKELGGISDATGVRQTYRRDTPEARRQELMPFLWTTLARSGQLYGNQAAGSIMRVTNAIRLSYPGYSEMLVGFADPRVDSNDKRPNPALNVLEWLNGRDGLNGRVAAFGSWDVLPLILNRERGGFFINAGLEPLSEPATAEVQLLNRLKAEVPYRWGEMPYDAITYYSALEYFKARQPRVFYLAFGETDGWAHAGRYEPYLNAARREDGYIKALWELAQSLPQYAGKTTLIVANDHGRGTGAEWKTHGKDIAGSDGVWLAIIGPDTPPLGERMDSEPVTQSQIAATVAALLGQDYCATAAEAAAPIADAVGARKEGARAGK